MTRYPYERYVSLGSPAARRRQRALAVLALGVVIATVVWLILSDGGAPGRHHAPKPSAAIASRSLI